MKSQDSSPPHSPRDGLSKRLRPAYLRLMRILPPRTRRVVVYALRHRRLPHLTDPATFTEKLNWRILNDRRPEIVEVCDKLRMREIARERVPDEHELHIVPLLWSGNDLRECPHLEGPSPWALKPSNSTGKVILGPDGRSVAELVAATRGWATSEPGYYLGEWGYTQVPLRFVLEQRLPGDQPPPEFKVFCFDGIPRFIQVHRDRFTRDYSIATYDPQWQPVAGHYVLGSPAPHARPANLDRVLSLARRLSAGWDFIRVDLYDIDGELWFGEFTPYPSGGSPFASQAVDRAVGQLWRLPSSATQRPSRSSPSSPSSPSNG
ncbi:MAG: hypothetical protein IPL93_13295 [Actinomycetales bacterium]|nr:hypothetical protein [Actinomycetales bacterium]HMT31951.1 ATP-grasp fold amidoligase family protein [Dermatophilaceae bacterium]